MRESLSPSSWSCPSCNLTFYTGHVHKYMGKVLCCFCYGKLRHINKHLPPTTSWRILLSECPDGSIFIYRPPVVPSAVPDTAGPNGG